MRAAPRVGGLVNAAASPFRGAAREPAPLREFERRAARRPGDQQASGPVPGDPSLLKSGALLSSAQQHASGLAPLQLPLAAREALRDFRKHPGAGAAATASVAGSTCSLDDCSAAAAGPAALQTHDDITASPFCDPGTLPQFSSLISEIQQRRELAAKERLAGCSGQHSLLPLPRSSITIGDAAIALIKSEPPSVPCAGGPGSGSASQGYRSPFGLPSLASSTGMAARNAAAALQVRQELQQPGSEAASPTHTQQSQAPWACSWPAAQPQASWQQQGQQASLPQRASKAATAAGKGAGGRRRAKHAAAVALDARTPGQGVQKKKVHSSTRMRQRLSDLTQQHEDLLNLAGALEKANAMLHQRWQRLSAEFDATLPSLSGAALAAAQTGADPGLQQLALAMQAPGTQQPAALAGAMKHSWDSLAGQLAAVLPDLETLPPQHTLRQPSCGSIPCGDADLLPAAAPADTTSSHASLDDLGPFASAAAAATAATAAAGSDAADALLRLASSGDATAAAAKAPAQKRHRRATTEELSLLFSCSLSLDAPVAKLANRNGCFRHACNAGAVSWHSPAGAAAAAGSAEQQPQQCPMVSPFSMAVGCFVTTPLSRALGLLENARGLAAQVVFSSAAAGSAASSPVCCFSCCSWSSRLLGPCQDIDDSDAAAPALHWQQVVDSLQLAPAQVSALQQLWAELQADHQRNHASRQALCCALAEQRSMAVAAHGTCGAGMAALAAVDDLAEQLQATLAADWTRLVRAYEQLLGEQSPLSFVQQVRLVVDGRPWLPDYGLMEALAHPRTA